MQPTHNDKAPRPYYLLLLPLFFVFHGYVENRDTVSFADAMMLGVWYLIAMLLLVFMLKPAFRSWQKAAIYTLLNATLCLFFGALHDSLKSIGEGFFSSYRFLLPVYLAAFIFIFVVIRKQHTSYSKMTDYANLLFAVLLVIDTVKLLTARQPSSPPPDAVVACKECTKPDIFLIIADEYAGEAVLQQVMGFSNKSFLDSLRQAGFQVLPKSTSNYNSTPYAMASLLSMDYLHDNPGRAAHAEDLNKAYRLINQNDVVRTLKSNGYIVFNHSIFKVDDQPPSVSSMFLTVGKRVIDVHTLWGRANRDLRFQLVTRFKWFSEVEGIAEVLNEGNEILIQKTEQVASKRTGAPKFVYTHLMLPHFPYLFDRNGQPAFRSSLSSEEWWHQDQYTEYLQYANKRLLSLIHTIQKQTNGEAVILLLSDHGFRQYNDERRQSSLVFVNLNAIYLPKEHFIPFPDTSSNVNQFRRLFNELFQQRYPLLKDSTILLP